MFLKRHFIFCRGWPLLLIPRACIAFLLLDLAISSIPYHFPPLIFCKTIRSFHLSIQSSRPYGVKKNLDLLQNLFLLWTLLKAGSLPCQKNIPRSVTSYLQNPKSLPDAVLLCGRRYKIKHVFFTLKRVFQHARDTWTPPLG